jgi:hypothetical protein
LHDFLARERISGRNYTETEALDLSVRNLSTEWHSKFRRLVECDRRTGRHEGNLPFHLSMSQLATSSMQYATEFGHDTTAPPATQNTRDRFPSSAPIIRHIEKVSRRLKNSFMVPTSRWATMKSISLCMPCLQTRRTLLYVLDVNNSATL